MPDTVIEMQPSTSASRTFTPSGRGVDGDERKSTTTKDQSGVESNLPGVACKNDSPCRLKSGRTPTTPSSHAPPSYKEAVFGETSVSDPLLPKPQGTSAPPAPKEIQPTAQMDVSSLIVKGIPPYEKEADNGPGMCCVVSVRLFSIVGVISGILLVYWEKEFQARVGPNPDYWAQKELHVREGFGWTFIVVGVLMYLCEGCMSFVNFEERNQKDLLGHLEKVKRGTPKLTWYMTTFNRDIKTVVLTNANGSLRTQERNNKITTWSGTQRFNFSKWADVTPDQTSSLGAINKITFHAKFVLADEKTKQAYEAQKRTFIDANKDKGQEYSVEDIFEIEGFENKMQTFGPSSSVVNACTFCLAFWTFWCYYPWLCFVRASTRRVPYTYVKELSA